MEQRLIIWSLNEGLGQPLLTSVEDEGSFESVKGPVSLYHLNGERAELEEADAVAMVLEYVDAQTLGIARGAMGRLPRDRNMPIAFLIHRPPGKQDFKMSCPHCGQKLWIRDSDVGKRGRCPNCKKAFDIPEQVALLREQLRLPGSVEVRLVCSEDADPIRSVLDSLMHQATGGYDVPFPAVKNETTVIELDVEDEG